MCELTFEEILKIRLDEETEDRRVLREKVRASIRKIGSQSVDTAEGYLMLAVIRVAIEDACSVASWLYNKKANKVYDSNATHRRTGIAYLRSDMPHAVIIGLEPQWIRGVLKKMNLIDL